METLSKTFLVMEYAGGGELYTYVHENGKLGEPVARSLFAQVVSAVEHLVNHCVLIKHKTLFSTRKAWCTGTSRPRTSSSRTRAG